MAGTSIGPLYFREDKSDGTPLAGGKLYAYEAGTSTPQDTYTNPDLADIHKNTNPVVLDAVGRALIFLKPLAYRFVLTDANGNQIYDIPSWTPYQGVTGAAGLDVVAVFGKNVVANDVVVLKSDGMWYKGDSDDPTLSVTPRKIGFAVTAALATESGTVRVDGQMSGFVGLTHGSAYYISATAGIISATAPTNMRLVGIADSSTTLTIVPTIAVFDNSLCNFRLTLSTGVPVPPSDVTAATTLFFTPCGSGNRIDLCDANGAPTRLISAEVSIAVPNAASQMYDVFAYNNSGVLTLELVAWTNDTTRATGVSISAVTGFYTKSGDITRRYVGSFRTTAVAGQTEDSRAKRFVWNYYNQENRALGVFESTNSWPYTTAAYRQANGSTANQLALVCGISKGVLVARVIGLGASDQVANGAQLNVAIGEDSTTTRATDCLSVGMKNPGANTTISPTASLTTVPAVGYHFYAWLERSSAAGTTTWYGDDGATITQAGIAGTWRA